MVLSPFGLLWEGLFHRLLLGRVRTFQTFFDQAADGFGARIDAITETVIIDAVKEIFINGKI